MIFGVGGFGWVGSDKNILQNATSKSFAYLKEEELALASPYKS